MDDNKSKNQGTGKKDDHKDPAVGGGVSVNKKKKPKTEAQIERERARRKRRRQKKKEQMMPGRDVPLFIGSDEGTASDVIPPPDVVPKETQTPPTFGEDEDFAPSAAGVDDENLNFKSDNAPPAPPEVLTPSEMEESQKVFEESPVYADPKTDEEVVEESFQDEVPEVADVGIPEAVQADFPAEDVPAEGLPAEDVPSEDLPSEDFSEENIVEEEYAAKEEALQEAQKISQKLVEQPPVELEEIPHKQGILGKIFDFVAGGANKDEDVSPRTEVSSEISTVSSDVESEKPNECGGAFGKFVKFVIKLAIFAALVVGAFWLGSSLKLMDFINGFFTSQPGVELNVGDNQKVVLDTQMLRAWGFRTASLLGNNQGDTTDLVYNVFFNANYFGKLKDPVFYGETGVSAAIFFGFGRDNEFFQNKFIYYVEYLEKLNLANKVTIEDVLDGKVRRDKALDAFIDETSQLFKRGNELRKEINVQVDDLKISTNSLQPDKDRYETDFFASLQKLEAQKADALINKFIDTTKAQVELKAKLAAMTKLSQYYEAILIEMKLRLDAVEKNREALISGVTVTETPGVDLKLIR